MSKVLLDELGIQSKWVESSSNTTQENARESAKILQKEGAQTAYLVTIFGASQGQKTIFEREGFQVVEAPMGFYQKKNFTPLEFFQAVRDFSMADGFFMKFLEVSGTG